MKLSSFAGPCATRPTGERAGTQAGITVGAEHRVALGRAPGFGAIRGRAAAGAIMLALAVGTGAAFAQDTGSAPGQPTDPATQGGDGTATIDLDRTEITADSLISRHQAAPRDPNKGPVTNLPLPRYVSLKGSEGNARRGPSLSHRIDWVFRHSGMPLRVVAEFGHWRRVEDQDGAGGWVHYSLLSGVRTAIITTDMAELRARADANGSAIARAEAGAIVRLHECSKDWCRVSGGGEKGWVPKTALWGVDPDETRD